MSQKAVADSGDLTPRPSRKGNVSVTSEVDPVQALHHAFHQESTLVAYSGAERHRRPFDAQYWACWLTAIVLPVLLAYLLITR